MAQEILIDSGVTVRPKAPKRNFPSGSVRVRMTCPLPNSARTSASTSALRFLMSSASPKKGGPSAGSPSPGSTSSPPATASGAADRTLTRTRPARANVRNMIGSCSAEEECAQQIDESRHRRQRNRPADPLRRTVAGERQRQQRNRQRAEESGSDPAVPVHARPVARRLGEEAPFANARMVGDERDVELLGEGVKHRKGGGED